MKRIFYMENCRMMPHQSDERDDCMTYWPDMERIDSSVADYVLTMMEDYDCERYTAGDVENALAHSTASAKDLGALLSPAAAPFLEAMARKARELTSRHFGNSVALFTPLYIDNHCENSCRYCGFRGGSQIRRRRLLAEEIRQEMEIIAESGIEEILLLTGEVHTEEYLEYIGEACRAASKYFRMTGLEIFPVNTAGYRYLHERGADFVTVFQETYDIPRYGELHPAGHKRVWPYRFYAQERALMAGMRGAGFAALLGLSDFRRDALAVALHVAAVQKKYPAAELSLSCPRLRPVVGGSDIRAKRVEERDLCQILCAWRIFLPFVSITLSSRESAAFRDGMVRIAATKISAGVSTGIGDHAKKYGGGRTFTSCQAGDEQFEINDSRSFGDIYSALAKAGLQPVVNDYIHV